MDHKKIEWLFLIVFVLIDIYLAIEIVRSPVSLSNTASNSSSSNIKLEMRSDGIDLPDHLSTTQESGYYLAAKNKDYLSDKLSTLTQVNASYSKATSTLTATPKNQVTIKGDQKQILKELNMFKDDSKNVPFGMQFKYEPNMSSSGSYIFVQNSEYGSIYDNSALLTINVKNGLIENYTMTYMGPVSSVRELQSTISPWHAVRSMYTDRELSNNSRVLKVKLGYSKLTDVRGSTILLPTWMVWIQNKTTKNTTVKRVNAFNGQMIQNNTSISDK